MAGTGDKLMTASEIKEVTDTKLIKDFSSLTALSGTPATGDLVPIKSGNDTYKIDYNALASAILGQISSNGVVNVANGGTGSNSATGALSGLIGALDTSSGFSLSDTIPVSINGTAYTITGLTLSNVIVGGGTGVTATLPIANGGTGAASASAARTALDVYSKSEVTTAISQSTAMVDVSTYFTPDSQYIVSHKAFADAHNVYLFFRLKPGFPDEYSAFTINSAYANNAYNYLPCSVFPLHGEDLNKNVYAGVTTTNVTVRRGTATTGQYGVAFAASWPKV